MGWRPGEAGVSCSVVSHLHVASVVNQLHWGRKGACCLGAHYRPYAYPRDSMSCQGCTTSCCALMFHLLQPRIVHSKRVPFKTAALILCEWVHPGPCLGPTKRRAQPQPRCSSFPAKPAWLITLLSLAMACAAGDAVGSTAGHHDHHSFHSRAHHGEHLAEKRGRDARTHELALAFTDRAH